MGLDWIKAFSLVPKSRRLHPCMIRVPRSIMKDDDFEWDDAKAAQNWANHGVSFETARLAFDDPFAVVREDQRRDYGEDRYVLVGMVQDHLLAVVHAQRRRAGPDLGPIGGTTGTTTLP